MPTHMLPMLVVSFFLSPLFAQAGPMDVGGKISLDMRHFPSSPEYSNQNNVTLSFSGSIEPEIVFESDSRDDRFTLTPFVRFDADDNRRTHGDVREANWLHFGGNWDTLVGISKVFWGVTESAHLVDIINQTDAVENLNGDAKLGQPMINYNTEQTWGTLSLFALPGFRPRTFTADNARLHGAYAIDVDNTSYESDQQEKHVDWAARWSHTLGDSDIAVSYFNGTSREPRLLAKLQGTELIFTPHYDQITQVGLELQNTTENTIWKGEAIRRTGHGDPFFAGVAGVEHTLYRIANSNMDLGLLMEYLYDDRNPLTAPPAIGNHDIFAGCRLTFNDAQDTAVLFGVLADHKTDAMLINFEAERRINDHLKMQLRATILGNIPDDDLLAMIRKDDFVEVNLDWYY